MRISDWSSDVCSSDLDSRHQAMEEAYPDAQIDALVVLLHALQEELPSLRHIAGHDDLDTAMVPASDDPQILVPRKRDPGPMFPWQRVLAEVSLQHVGRGYAPDRSEAHTSELQSQMTISTAVFC